MKIRPFTETDKGAFRDLNLAWIERYFDIEDEDRAQLNDPDTHILGRGGIILVAEIENEVVGTVGLVPGHDAGELELIKMSAREDLRGKGIGRGLMEAAINKAKELGATSLWLETSTKLDAALHLYKKVGFRELTAEECAPTPYARCNCQMVLEL